MEFLNLFFIFLIGTVIGSFLGVVVDRLPREESIIHGRSHCEFCKKTLRFWDLIPLFSFLFLRGKCRYCQKKLSWFYPLIELTTGILFVLVALQLGIQYQELHINYIVNFLYYLFIVSSLIVIFFTDLKYGIIPFFVVFPAIIVTFLYLPMSTLNFIPNILAAIGAFLFFLALFLFTRGRGMGFGDVVYVFLMGLLLGFPNIVVGLYIGFVSGAIAAIILVILKRKKMHGDTIAFGPFLVFGTMVMLLWGSTILNLTLTFLGFRIN